MTTLSEDILKGLSTDAMELKNKKGAITLLGFFCKTQYRKWEIEYENRIWTDAKATGWLWLILTSLGLTGTCCKRLWRADIFRYIQEDFLKQYANIPT